MPILASIINFFRSLLFAKELEIAIVGLQAAGKTSLVNALGFDQWSEDVTPTVAFSLRQVKRGGVQMKVWDVAGQPKFRTLWDRYCRGTDAIVFVVDSAEPSLLPSAQAELHALLQREPLNRVPLLVLGNKNDLAPHLSVEELIEALELNKISNRPVSCYSCSMKSRHNLDIVLAWLTQRAR